MSLNNLCLPQPQFTAVSTQNLYSTTQNIAQPQVLFKESLEALPAAASGTVTDSLLKSGMVRIQDPGISYLL